MDTSDRNIDWRGVNSYLAICFGVTWTIEIACLALGLRFDEADASVTPILALVMFIPAISAFAVRKWVTKEGFATANLCRGPIKPYLLVWMAVPSLFALIYGVTTLLGFGKFEPDFSNIIRNLPPLPPGKTLPPPEVLIGSIGFASLTVGVLITSIFTFGEEFGWTGYLLPALAPLGKWQAIILYGAIWGVWHAPLVWGGFNYPGHPIAGMILMCLFTISIGITQYFLLERYRSVYLTSVLHGCVNSQGRGIWPMLFTQIHPILGGLVGLIGIALITIGGLALHGTKKNSVE